MIYVIDHIKLNILTYVPPCSTDDHHLPVGSIIVASIALLSLLILMPSITVTPAIDNADGQLDQIIV